ncbi:uncharacterized protein LOC113048870 isoform X2 [Carassius auratus]|uniref:Uncharacterized protein LOC113048870 isoform X2 n=1 Tax=Carassius auratus TaxID=7957 RepID=A0A6P6K312_CARAU|nr:uncharacterized protein LOC113048870 isoform X2 [Carassius auratus]
MMESTCVFMSILMIVADGFIVRGPSGPLVALLGSSVVLPCYVDELLVMEVLKVEWKRTDSETLVHLFWFGKSRPEFQEQDYHDRAHFFTDQIQHGNFSLRLDNLRTEDEGEYICRVHRWFDSGETVVQIKLGFSSWHIAVLFFCSAAGSGAVLLLCSLIYCRYKNTVTSSIIMNLQVSLVFCPNICMFFAFMLWGFTEGSLHETVTCCALYLLRPVMLMWALCYLKNLQDNHKSWIRFFRITHELTVLTVIVYSVLFAYGWRISAHDTDNGPRIFSGIWFGCVVLFCLLSEGLYDALCIFLSFFQLLQLIPSFGLPSPVFLILVFVQPLMLFCIPLLTYLQARLRCLHHRWITILGILIITLLDIILVIYANLTILEREKENLEWIYVILFIEVLKIAVVIEICVLKHMLKEEEHSRVQRRRETETSQQGSNSLSLCNEIMFMFGAVGLVLLNSVTLTAELILKARNGERVMKDMRVIVFPSESVFVLCWLISQMHANWRNVITGSTHNQRNLHQRVQLMNTPETREMEILSAADPDVSQTQR